MGAKSEVWPNGIPALGQVARRSRAVTARDIELFTELETRVLLADGSVVLEGTAACCTMPLARAPGR